MRADSLVLGADGWFPDQGMIHLTLPHRHKGSHIVLSPVSGAPQLGRTELDEHGPGRDAPS